MTAFVARFHTTQDVRATAEARGCEREAAAAQTALQGPITKEGSLGEVSLHAEAIPVATSTAVFKSNKLPKRNKALKDLVGPFKSAKISKISKEHRTQKINAFKLKLRVPRALSAAAVEADVAGSSFAFDAHSVSRFIGLHSDCVSESRTREAQSGYI